MVADVLLANIEQYLMDSSQTSPKNPKETVKKPHRTAKKPECTEEAALSLKSKGAEFFKLFFFFVFFFQIPPVKTHFTGGICTFYLFQIGDTCWAYATASLMQSRVSACQTLRHDLIVAALIGSQWRDVKKRTENPGEKNTEEQLLEQELLVGAHFDDLREIFYHSDTSRKMNIKGDFTGDFRQKTKKKKSRFFETKKSNPCPKEAV